MDKDGALILSCSSLSPIKLIEGIIGTDIPAPCHPFAPEITAFPCHIETKYYSADINLYTFENKNIFTKEFKENVHAIVLHFDNTMKDAMKTVNSWLPFLEHYKAEVQLLVCNKCNDSTEKLSELSKKAIWEWCIKENFELVELEAEEDDAEDDFKETTGYKRIVQALHAYMWPDMELKESPSYNQSELLKHVAQQDKINKEADEKNIACAFKDLDLDGQTGTSQVDEAARDVSKEEDQGEVSEDVDFGSEYNLDNMSEENFEALFEKLGEIKNKASNLSGQDRKKYAEKITLAFWKALGGDEAEIEDLASED